MAFSDEKTMPAAWLDEKLTVLYRHGPTHLVMVVERFWTD
jgi:hypothetical protein